MIDPLIRHQAYLQRYASGEVKKSEVLLENMLVDVKARLMVGGNTVFQEARLSVLEKDITAILTAYGKEFTAASTATTAALVPNEIDFYEKTLAEAITVSVSGVSINQVIGAVNDDLVVLVAGSKVTTATPKGLIDLFTTTANRDVIHTVRAGIVDGSTTGQISAAVDDLVTNRTRRQSEALVRTLINHASSKTSSEVSQANSDVIKDETWFAFLDGRTTVICAGRDGKRYPVGEGPHPPAHYNAVCGGEYITIRGGNKPIEDVVVGDYALTHKGMWRKVTAVMGKKNESDYIRVITLNSGVMIRVTDDHPILVDGVGWVDAKTVKIGDNLFENMANEGEVNKRFSIVEGLPNDYPSIFDSEEVFLEVRVESGSMASSINLDNNPTFCKCKVSNRVTNYKLPGITCYSMVLKKVVKGLFSFPVLFKLVFCLGYKHFIKHICSCHRVIFNHFLRPSCIIIAGIFIKSPSIVILTNTDTVCYFNFGCNATRRLSGWWCNLVNTIPPTHGSVCKGKLSFNLTKSFPFIGFNKFNKKIPNLEFCNHWVSSCVRDITTVAYTGNVYNIEVAEDNTYLVNGVVVHNCRSVRVPNIKDKFRVGGVGERASIDGPVPADLTYSSWLKRQPKSFQDDMLGPERAKLFRDGKITLDKFVDDRGLLLTLDELKVLN